MPDKSTEQTRVFSAMVAKKQGWTLNPDSEFYESLIDGLTVNYNRYGYYLCPCRDTEGTREADSAVICPCVYARPDVAEFGHCFCALYLSPDFAASGVAPGGIKDRRFGS